MRTNGALEGNELAPTRTSVVFGSHRLRTVNPRTSPDWFRGNWGYVYFDNSLPSE
jgi:hypothetical protein